MIAIPYLTASTTCFSYGLLFVFGQIRDFFRKIIDWWSARCFNRLIASAPDAWFDVVERYSNDYNITLNRCLNLVSYNYLGFAASDEHCTPRAIEMLKKYYPSTTDLHNELEECVANFVGKPAAIVFGMGYVTNSAVLPVLMWKGGLIVSDSLNHNSIVNGARGSGARVCVFQHNSKFISYYITVSFLSSSRRRLPSLASVVLLLLSLSLESYRHLPRMQGSGPLN
ncbi:long chain base biosynthesis protein 2a [Pyrus ussuriensis x Pyrus communis]|uniref:Long chain base biosynthesis protein 2a n=1 Tax=Pyrus ussuriensis x Pyrus communis TaxID=2448454 RepID=A0A5N5G0B6_9ROSA|nr:long chain base biosynthesis protein 2a [Pyrus ussuriensis x Pyrus communis]